MHLSSTLIGYITFVIVALLPCMIAGVREHRHYLSILVLSAITVFLIIAPRLITELNYIYSWKAEGLGLLVVLFSWPLATIMWIVGMIWATLPNTREQRT